jgi:hypothetical protein
MTGDYDFDATIMHRSNSDLPNRLSMYLRGPRGSAGAYGPRGYAGYSGNSGDD